MGDWQYVDRAYLTELLVNRHDITYTQVAEAFVEAQRDERDYEIRRLETIVSAQKRKLLELGITSVEIVPALDAPSDI